MSIRAPFAILAFALLAVGTAAAGTADDPDVTDATLDATGPANAYADLTKGWLEQDGDVVTATIEVARIDVLQHGLAYIMTFEAGGKPYYVGLIEFETTKYFTGGWNPASHTPKDAEDATGSFKAGSPAQITIDFASDTFGTNVTKLEKISLEVIDFKTGPVTDIHVPMDVAVGDKAFELVTPYTAPIGTESTDAPPPAANVPLPIWAPILAALGVAAFRRRA